MLTFRFIFLWIAAFAVLQHFLKISYLVRKDGYMYYRWGLFWAAVLFAPVFLMAFRGPMLGDVYTYVASYERLPGTWSGLRDYLKENGWSGIGFHLMEEIMRIFLGPSRNVFRFVVALIHSLPVILIMRRYSEDYPLSIYLFVAAGCLNSWMMNGLRQFISVVIIFAATPLMLRKRYLELILLILLATSVHTSALIMLPVVFIVQGKVWNRKTMLYIVAAVIAAYLFSTREGLFDLMLEGTEYQGTMASAQSWGDNGMNPIRVLVMSAPMVLAFVCRNKMSASEDPIISICTNMSVITAGISIIAMVTSGIMTGRLPIYTELYSYILLPTILHRAFAPDSRRLLTALLVLLYFGYYCYGYIGLLL